MNRPIAAGALWLACQAGCLSGGIWNGEPYSNSAPDPAPSTDPDIDTKIDTKTDPNLEAPADPDGGSPSDLSMPSTSPPSDGSVSSACVNPNFDLRYVERDLWLWDESVGASASTSAAFTNFFTYAERHHVVTVYAAAESMLRSYSSGSSTVANWRTFIQTAANKCIRVEFLIGSACQSASNCMATEAGWPTAILLTQKAAQFAQDAPGAKPFGIHFDAEPHQLPTWSTDSKNLVGKLSGMLHAAMQTPHGAMIVNVDIPRWYDGSSLTGVPCHDGTKDAHKCIIDTVDITTLMDYVDTGARVISDGQTEVDYATSVGKKVVLGVETGSEADGTTFYQELRNQGGATYSGLYGTQFLEAELAIVSTSQQAKTGFARVAVHHYGSLRAADIIDNF